MIVRQNWKYSDPTIKYTPPPTYHLSFKDAEAYKKKYPGLEMDYYGDPILPDGEPFKEHPTIIYDSEYRNVRDEIFKSLIGVKRYGICGVSEDKPPYNEQNQYVMPKNRKAYMTELEMVELLNSMPEFAKMFTIKPVPKNNGEHEFHIKTSKINGQYHQKICKSFYQVIKCYNDLMAKVPVDKQEFITTYSDIGTSWF